MKAAALVLAMLLTGCASKCPDCLTLTPAQLGAAMYKAWQKGYSSGYQASDDAADLQRLKAL